MMYDFIVGATLQEIKDWKAQSPLGLYEKFREVTPRSADRLRGVAGVDSWIFLPGFLALPAERQEKVRAYLELGTRESRRDHTKSAMQFVEMIRGFRDCSHS